MHLLTYLIESVAFVCDLQWLSVWKRLIVVLVQDFQGDIGDDFLALFSPVISN